MNIRGKTHENEHEDEEEPQKKLLHCRRMRKITIALCSQDSSRVKIEQPVLLLVSACHLRELVPRVDCVLQFVGQCLSCLHSSFGLVLLFFACFSRFT